MWQSWSGARPAGSTAHSISLLTTMKSLPLAYNKDMQEDKEPVFDAVDTVKLCLPVFAAMIDTMTVHAGEHALRRPTDGFINATDCADYLTKKGMPFRDAYTAVGKLVLLLHTAGQDAGAALALAELQDLSPLFERGRLHGAGYARPVWTQRKSYGGPAHSGDDPPDRGHRGLY